jgi:hypothetical protein
MRSHNQQGAPDIPTARQYLANFNRRHPGLWAYVDQHRDPTRTDRPPGVLITLEELMAGFASYLQDRTMRPTQTEQIAIVHDLVTLYPWRFGQNVYRFHPTLFRSLIETEGLDKINTDMLTHLPAWGVYVETPGFRVDTRQIDGFLASICALDRDRIPMATILYLVRNSFWDETNIVAHSAMILLETTTIRDAIHANDARSLGWGESLCADRTISLMESAISLLLYLSIETPFETHPRKPQNISGKRVRGKQRYFPDDQNYTWDIGLRIGAAIDHSQHSEKEEASDARTSESEGRKAQIPHLRKPHWHTFLYGPRANATRERKLRWLHPILVNSNLADSLDDLPTVLHNVD